MKILITLFYSIFAFSLCGQVILTNKLTPAVGDSLYFAIDSTSGSVNITAPGTNQYWDFSSLKPITSRADLYRDPSTGINYNSFPSADVLLLQGINELYYKVYSNRIELLGTATRGGGPFPGVGDANVYPKPVVVQKYPQNYLDKLSYTTTNSIKFSSDIIPDSLLNSLPIKPDSFRINFNVTFQKEVDSWGSLTLPSKTWNVQREKQSTISKTTVDAKVAFFGWVDVTALASGVFGGLFGDFITYSYAFVSDETKGVIALVSVDSMNNVLNVQYKPDDKIVLKTNITGSINTIAIFPNPAGNEIYFSLNDLHSGTYSISVIDIQGKSYLSEELFLNENSITKRSIDKLPSGSYFLQLSDNKKQMYNSGVFQKQ